MPPSNSIWLLAEHIRGNLSDGYRELLAVAQGLSGGSLELITTILLGWRIEEFSEAIARLAGSNLISVDDPALEDYEGEAHLHAIDTLVSCFNPDVVLFESSPIGDDLAARLAARMNIGLVTGCSDLEFDEDGNLLFFKPLSEGSVQAVWLIPDSRPQLATIRVGTNPLAYIQKFVSPECRQVQVEINLDPVQTQSKGYVIVDPDNLALEEADIVVDGGKGVGSAEGFELLEELALTLGGKLGCSRTVVDLGWQPRERQIGQTGKKVRPGLLICCGISGSMYHTAGIKNAGSIIAINTDPQAPIFDLADLGVIGDLHRIIPALNKGLSERAGTP